MLESNTWTSLVLEPHKFVSNAKLIISQKKTFAISELKLCTFLVLHSLNMFVRASSGQAGSMSKKELNHSDDQNFTKSFIVSLKNFSAELTGFCPHHRLLSHSSSTTYIDMLVTSNPPSIQRLQSGT